eukprot:5418726-Amphidinium_carterae.1
MHNVEAWRVLQDGLDHINGKFVLDDLTLAYWSWIEDYHGSVGASLMDRENSSSSIGYVKINTHVGLSILVHKRDLRSNSI